jgi:hypothetical protein
MKFFFPDSQDLVDPSFDFETEKRSDTRVRQRDDLYAHEVFKKPPYDGILVSLAIVKGIAGSTGRYTLGQQRRFAVEGAREFLRLPGELGLMGDCGAFSYIKEPVPPVSVEQVVRFYEESGFDFGASVDHIILDYNADWDRRLPGIDTVPEDCRRRQELTIELARDFQQLCRTQAVRFEPIGIAQGWSPQSYAKAFSSLQKMGYRYIALGGLVPLKSFEILQVLQAIAPKMKSLTTLHLFGVTRLDHVKQFARYGVVSFDSTSPLTQAFKEDRDNYYGRRRNYAAIRVPQVDTNVQLKNRVQSGQVKQEDAFRLERECLAALRSFDRRKFPRSEMIQLLSEYQELYGSRRNYSTEYEALLRDRPWKDCRCTVCQELGIDVVIFRGAERNRRRGFHNVYVTYNRLKRIRKALCVGTKAAD